MRTFVLLSAVGAAMVFAGCVRDTTELRAIPDPTSPDRHYHHDWSGLRLTVPGDWERASYGVEYRAGADPGGDWSGAPFGMRVTLQPGGDGPAPETLFTVMMFTEETWREIAAGEGEAVGQALHVHHGWVSVGRLAEENPYEAESAAWRKFEAMRPDYGRLAEMVEHRRLPLLGPDAPLEYEAELPTASGSGRIVRLTLEYGGDAELTTVYIEEQDRFDEPGQWHAGNGVITVEFADEDMAPFQWKRDGDDLVPEAWDENLYGGEGLPLTLVPDEPDELVM